MERNGSNSTPQSEVLITDSPEHPSKRVRSSEENKDNGTGAVAAHEVMETKFKNRSLDVVPVELPTTEISLPEPAKSSAGQPESGWPEKVRVFTWNIAECIPSASAPGWSKACDGWDSSVAHMYIVATIISMDADIVCLQEAPSASFSFDESAYVLLGSERSHCGYVQLFVRHFLLRLLISSFVVGPAVCASFVDGITIASMHLQPFPGEVNGQKRVKQLQNVRKQGQESFIFAGDANMRNNDATAFRRTESGIIDVHDDLNNGTPPTWNTYVNKYHANSKEYTCNFDRIFLGGRFKAEECHVVCNTPASERPHHFLSDHFGLLATVIRQ